MIEHTQVEWKQIENKLNGNNYKEWKWNLIIVLSCEKLKIVLNNKGHWPLKLRLENPGKKSDKTTKAILNKLEDMCKGQATLAQKSTITSLMNDQ
ncbi:hypothetical protein EPI10_006099 [Gossypium australe]|uniref:Uncharacterized protein n=1 Tax=Gossypium australe TaxID=47621 RepID=A0A5B6WT30_9ROSI|nr:hypothetical protein EPI10_006099 [Gossypium australe]